ncbi:MAG: flagellin lysine-N-methylase [Oscillospiraceae bacterium]|nr:flagellin lysine-N-methylase [Oscillospiraceae bacterium]
MTVHTPNYYSRFRCLAGDCPHTCCGGWEVPIDPQTAQFYRTLDGPLGERLRSTLTVDEQGEWAFRLRGEYCPFLNDKKLCEIHIQLGQEYTGLICRTHPRFSYDYGPLNEVGLCASCPEAARLILEGDMTLTVTQDDRPGEERPSLLAPLLIARETTFELLRVEEATLSERLRAMLLFANEVQVLLDEDRAGDIPGLCAVYGEEFPLIEPGALPDPTEAMEQILKILSGLEILRPQWGELLAAGQARLGQGQPLPSPPPKEGERTAAYFLYRHWLRGVWDGDILTWAEFAALGVAVTALLSPLHPEGFPGVFRQLCEELEHNQDNLNAIQEALWKVPLPPLLALTGT